MNSLESFWHATADFWGQITDVRVSALLIAVGFTLANLLLRASAWRIILQAAYPEGRVRWRSITGAYLAGVGINAIVPARGGDVMKIYLAHRSMPKAAYTTITSSLLAETLVDIVVGPALLIAAYLTGRIPNLPALGHLAAFEWSFFAAHARWFMLGLAVALILLGVFFTYVERHVVAFWDRVRLGLAILTTPRRYFRTVVPLQLLGWCCRIAAMYWFLAAFRVPAGVVERRARALGTERLDTAAADARRRGHPAGAPGIHVPRCGRDQQCARVQCRHAVRDHTDQRDRRRARNLVHAAPAAVEGPPRGRRFRRGPRIAGFGRSSVHAR